MLLLVLYLALKILGQLRTYYGVEFDVFPLNPLRMFAYFMLNCVMIRF